MQRRRQPGRICAHVRIAQPHVVAVLDRQLRHAQRRALADIVHFGLVRHPEQRDRRAGRDVLRARRASTCSGIPSLTSRAARMSGVCVGRGADQEPRVDGDAVAARRRGRVAAR